MAQTHCHLLAGSDAGSRGFHVSRCAWLNLLEPRIESRAPNILGPSQCRVLRYSWIQLDIGMELSSSLHSFIGKLSHLIVDWSYDQM